MNDKEIQKVEDMEVSSKKRETPLGRYEENVTCRLAPRKERVTDDKANSKVSIDAKLERGMFRSNDN